MEQIYLLLIKTITCEINSKTSQNIVAHAQIKLMKYQYLKKLNYIIYFTFSEYLVTLTLYTPSNNANNTKYLEVKI